MDTEKTLKFVKEAYERKGGVVDTLQEYIKIPNQSPEYDPEWQTNGYMQQAVDLLLGYVKAQKVEKLEVELITEKDRTPLIYMNLPARSCDKKETILLYGHLDKQPPLTEAWKEGLHPYKPVIIDGKLYGRGGADDGYSTFSVVTLMKYLEENDIPHPRMIGVIEACEESGSPDLPFYIKKMIAEDKVGDVGLIICLDSGCGNYEQFWITSSLRGIVSGVLDVHILNDGVHSGSASGIVASSFRIMRMVMQRIEDVATGKVLIDEMHVDIPQKRIDQAKDAAAILGDKIYKEFPFVEGAGPISTDLTELLLNRTWRPAISTTGMAGFPAIENAGNVLRTRTTAKLSIRVPPGIDCEAARSKLKEVLEKDPPYGAKVTFTADEPAAGWASPLMAEWLDKSVDTNAKAFFNGKKPIQFGEGGTIPFMGMLGKLFPKAQFVITGVLGPNSNAHGPNEMFHIDMAERVTAVVTHICADYANAK